MEKKNWLERLDALNSGCADDFQSCVTAIDEHALAIVRELGACEMGVGPNSQEALSQMAMLLECAKMLRDSGLDLAEERTPTGLPNHLIDPRSTDAMDLVMGTLKRCGFNKATQKAVVLTIAGELDKANGAQSGGDHQTAENGVHNADLEPKTAGDGVIGGDHQTSASRAHWTEMARFREREDLKRSLIGPGEVLVEESFLRQALEAIESILEMAPHIRQVGDGGPSIEDEGTRAFSSLRAALRSGTRAIVEVDIDTSDLKGAAE